MKTKSGNAASPGADCSAKISPWYRWPTDELKKEIKHRLVHFYGRTDGTFDFPNNAEGDLLKIVCEYIRRD